MTEKKAKQEKLYVFLFHNIMVISKEVKPQQKYKVLIVIKLRASLKVFTEDEEEDTGRDKSVLIWKWESRCSYSIIIL